MKLSEVFYEKGVCSRGIQSQFELSGVSTRDNLKVTIIGKHSTEIRINFTNIWENRDTI